jgi:hypothetical protein
MLTIDRWKTKFGGQLNAGDSMLSAYYGVQHTARRARIEELQAEIKRRDAAAVPASAPVAAVGASDAPRTPRAMEEPMHLLSTKHLREHEQITAAAMLEVGRLAGRGGTDGFAAAKRLPSVTARLKAIRKELAERNSMDTEDAPLPVPAGAPSAEPARGLKSQAETLGAAVDAARRRQAEFAARGREQPSRQHSDYEVPGRRLRM